MFIAFRVKPGRDDDLISWLDGLGEGDRSYHIREALRQGLVRQVSTQPVIKIQPKKASQEAAISEVDLEAALDSWDC